MKLLVSKAMNEPNADAGATGDLGAKFRMHMKLTTCFSLSASLYILPAPHIPVLSYSRIPNL